MSTGAARTADVVHHLYPNGPAVDLVPYCGALPGRDELTGDWNTGHDRDELLQCLGFGLPVYMVCASPEALGGFTPLILSDDKS
ncbi:hypothetical protein [Microbacterium excoecariae]|uniref:hypothetical protein n=1 Tax=Microbacterium excoecariae TaxID=2715210 RepID=UPI00140873F3|nr:hypothetical protein [Microbacterium excoecariae]NHI17264.1 hypothetical protein [Microbacterium excoecariae]